MADATGIINRQLKRPLAAPVEMPRASLPAATPKTSGVSRSNSTAKRSSHLDRGSAATPTSTARTSKRKRSSPSPESEEEEESRVAGVDGDGPVDDAERELEAWQDFAAEYYEIVEQLPLELHRNFRLLRELDESCHVQTVRLERMIRNYIAHRLKPPPPPSPPPAQPPEASQEESIQTGQVVVSDEPDGEKQPDEPAQLSLADTCVSQDAMEAAEAESEPSEPIEEVDEQEAEAVEHQVAAASMGVPRPDGHGGLVLPPEEPNQVDLPEPRRAFPSPGSSSQRQSATPLKPETPHKAEQPHEPSITEAAGGDEELQAPDATPAKDGQPVPVASPPVHRPPPSSRSLGPGKKKVNMLPEIAKVVKEIVRNGEEKLALAVGAYNSIDRHIRALDSALSAQEASMILGLRPSTMPSAAVEGAPIPELPNEDPDAGVVIGITGGSRKNMKNGKNSRKDKKGKAMPAQEKGILEQERERLQQTGIVIEFDAPSSEPRYCYCQQVSHGEMIGCDNDDCPLEWFHLPCVGLQRPPTGSWFCELCKPKHQPHAATSHKKKSRKSR